MPFFCDVFTVCILLSSSEWKDGGLVHTPHDQIVEFQSHGTCGRMLGDMVTSVSFDRWSLVSGIRVLWSFLWSSTDFCLVTLTSSSGGREGFCAGVDRKVCTVTFVQGPSGCFAVYLHAALTVVWSRLFPSSFLRWGHILQSHDDRVVFLTIEQAHCWRHEPRVNFDSLTLNVNSLHNYRHCNNRLHCSSSEFYFSKMIHVASMNYIILSHFVREICHHWGTGNSYCRVKQDHAPKKNNCIKCPKVMFMFKRQCPLVASGGCKKIYMDC